MRAPLALASVALLGGCNLAKLADTSTVRQMAPGILAVPDVGLGCSTGRALAPVVGALPGSDKAPPHRALVLTEMSAAMCAEPMAWDAELRGAVAAREGRTASAQDMFEEERRHHAVAAKRYWRAWTHLGAAFGPTGEGACPTLSDRDNEGLLYVLGLSSGLLALVHDGASGGQVGVPFDTPLFVARAAACLDDATWWGVPSALQATVWATVPGALPDGQDAFATLEAAAARGDAANVRLARAFQVQTLSTVGRTDALRAAISAHAAALEADTRPEDPRGLLNDFATLLIRHESDRQWVAEVGHRTPAGQLGTFPVDPADVPTLEGVDDLLDSLLPDAPAEDAAAPASEETP